MTENTDLKAPGEGTDTAAFSRAYRRKKFDPREMIGSFLVDDGFAHIVCKVANRDELINHYSIPGYEVLSSDFAAYMEELLQYIPPQLPVLLEIVGCSLSPEDQASFQNAVRNHFELKATHCQLEKTAKLIRKGWFAFCLALIAVTIFLFRDTTQNQVILNLIFILFYFFGDRLTELILLDSRMMRSRRARYVQLACMKILFTADHPLDRIDPADAQSYREEILRMAEEKRRR